MALVEVRISGLAVLDGVRVTPGPGFTALTGETGSGKSLCISGLRLALGGKVDADLVRAGRQAASVAAVFDEAPPHVRCRLQAHGIPEDDLLTLVRELPRSGRGACRVNGALVSLATLRELGDHLVEVTAQGESHRLLRPGHQRALVDAAGGAELTAARSAMVSAHHGRRQAGQALAELESRLAGDAVALEAARGTLAELEPLRLRVAEEEEMAGERRRLRHLEGLAVAVAAVRSAAGGEGGAADALAGAVLAGRAVEGIDASVDELLASTLEELERLHDLTVRARDLAGSFDLDPGRLAALEERLDVLDRVRRRHGSVATALADLELARELVAAADGGGGAVAAAREAAHAAEAAAAEAALRLSHLRAVAAAHLDCEVTARLRCLRLPQARFRTTLGRIDDPDGLPVEGVRVACGPDGIDQVEMRLATIRDGMPIPLAGGVSGGELSRVALALRSVVAAADDCPTLVLDEVDTGVGGDTAARVGEVLAAVGERRQLLVVTHRAEIAARSTCHLRVERPAGGPSSRIDLVEGAARTHEVARLLSGSPTPAALARAAELLERGCGTPAAARAVLTMTPP